MKKPVRFCKYCSKKLKLRRYSYCSEACSSQYVNLRVKRARNRDWWAEHMPHIKFGT